MTTLTISAEQARLAEATAGRGGRRRPGRRAAARLPRGTGRLRRGRQRRDDRGGRRALLADVLRRARPAAHARRPGGPAGDHACAHDRMLATRDDVHVDAQVRVPRRAASRRCGRSSSTWREHTALRVAEQHQPSASTTRGRCARWRERFDARAETVAALGFDSTFRRMWDFYLAYCEAGFRAGYLDVFQFSLAAPMSRPVAARLADMVERLLGASLPVRIRAWDGSEAGATDGPVVVIRHRRALRRLLWSPGELGLARAFVAGDLEVEGDVAEGLSRFWTLAKAHHLTGLRPSPREALAAAGLALRLGAVGPRPRPPSSEARLEGRLHTRRRDRAAIAHHYDLSNDFYAFLLDPQMAYSCGYWTQEASAVLRPRRRPARQARPHLPQARAPARHAAVGRRLRVGVAPRARGPALRRAGHGRDALGPAAGLRAGQGRGTRPRRPGRDPVAGLPGAHR